MIRYNIDGVSFDMKSQHDFSFLRSCGRVFRSFDQSDSGNISFGLDDGNEKYFVKVAGGMTVNSCTSPQRAIEALKSAMPIYCELAHPHLVQLVDHFPANGLYAAVFKWAEGDCLFDYWNFQKYESNCQMPPRERFKKLPMDEKIAAFDTIFDFLMHTESKGFVAVDFYDGSIMYDFRRARVTICDIDFFRKGPSVNDMGENFWGTRRLKAPEEYVLGAEIDSATNVFALGALLMHFFGEYTSDEVQKMYAKKTFFPCRYENWQLGGGLYQVTLKAVSHDRAGRHGTLADFYEEWNAGVSAL
ncbi:MAG: hypothetical protein ACOX8S_04145 [Christensenellales bacterium]|jgi:serine/threonine protein kinase